MFDQIYNFIIFYQVAPDLKCFCILLVLSQHGLMFENSDSFCQMEKKTFFVDKHVYVSQSKALKISFKPKY